MEQPSYYLGLPLWANAHWKGSLFRQTAKPAEFLAQYAQVFNAVEGNTTFYSVPSSDMVQRWLAATSESFRFSFKFPQTITHRQHLRHVNAETHAFLQRLDPLGQRINGLMVQLPANFSPDALPVLAAFLAILPTTYTYAVEVRHPAFFTDAQARERLNALLQDKAVDRIIFESRPVHAAPPLDEATREAQARKPRLPVQLDTTAQQPVLRYIGHPLLADNSPWLARWVAQTARWISAGMQPRVFIHTPSNELAPALAWQFHQQLQAKIPTLPDLPQYLGKMGVSHTLLL